MSSATADYLSAQSPVSYMSKVRIPVLLGQGEWDQLFNLQEGTGNYQQLRAQGTPVKMIWQSWGHTRGGAAPGEYPVNGSTLGQTAEGQAILDWYSYYLRGQGPAPTLDFSWFRDWAYTGAGGSLQDSKAAAAAAYASAPSYPLPAVLTYDMSGTDTLLPAGSTVTPAPPPLLRSPVGSPLLQRGQLQGDDYINPTKQCDPSDVTGTYAQWTTAPLSTDTDVVGVPALTFTVSSGEPQTSDPVTHLALFAKLYDVSPDGTFQLPGRAISAVRVPGALAAGQPTSVTVQLPGIAHRFAKGHQLRVVLASGDAHPRCRKRICSYYDSCGDVVGVSSPVRESSGRGLEDHPDQS